MEKSSDFFCQIINKQVVLLQQRKSTCICIHLQKRNQILAFHFRFADDAKFRTLIYYFKNKFYNTLKTLTLIVLMWRIGWAHNNARK